MVSGRIDAVRVNSGRPAGCPDDVPAVDQRIACLFRTRCAVQAQKAEHPLAVRQNTDNLHTVQHRNALRAYGSFQHLRHSFAGIRAGASRAAARIMVGFVADVFPVTAARKFHAKLRQPQKARRGERRLAQRGIAVNALAVKKRLRHFAHTVSIAAGERQLVIGLLVAAGIAAGAAEPVLGQQQNVVLTGTPEAVCRVIARCAAADNGGIAAVELRA